MTSPGGFTMEVKDKLTTPLDLDANGDLANGSRALTGRCDG